MVWEIVLGVILAIGILTAIREFRLKRVRKKKTALSNEGRNDGISSE